MSDIGVVTTGSQAELTPDDLQFLESVVRRIRFRGSRSPIANVDARLQNEFDQLEHYEPFVFARLAELLARLGIKHESVERKLLLMASIGNGTCRPTLRSAHRLEVA